MDHHVSGSLLFLGREDQVTKEYQVEDFGICMKQPPAPAKKKKKCNCKQDSLQLFTKEGSYFPLDQRFLTPTVN